MTLVPDAISYRASKLRVNTQATTSSGYKTFFRALQTCSGNVTAMTKVARDFIGAGLLAGVVVNPDMFSATAEKTVNFFTKLESMKTEREFPGIPRRPQGTNPTLSSSGGGQHHQAGYDDPFLKLANEMFVAYTDSEPHWSGGMPMSVEGNDNNGQSYYGREGVPPSMVMSMEKYNPQPYHVEKGVQPGMAEAMFRQADHVNNGYYLSPEEGWAGSMKGSHAGGADARSFSYGGGYPHGLTPYTTPCNNYTANNGPMVCGFCLDSTCRCYYTQQQHAGNMHFQPPPLPSGHTMGNPGISAPSTSTAITVAGAASEYRPSVLTCPGQHGLTSWVTLAHGYPCYFCGGMIAGGVSVLSCSLCQVYACPSCVWMHHNTAS